MLTCIATILIGFSTPMTVREKQTLESAKTGCQKLYKDAPCLTKLIKKEELVYNAICGKKVKK